MPDPESSDEESDSRNFLYITKKILTFSTSVYLLITALTFITASMPFAIMSGVLGATFAYAGVKLESLDE